MKKVLSLVLFIILVLALSVTVFAADIIASGYCGGEDDGTNLEWKIDSDDVLTIFGKGTMADYDIAQNGDMTTPWFEHHFYEKSIKKVIIEDGVTYIGKCAFQNIKELEEFPSIPEIVRIIGDYAFCNMLLSGELHIPEGVEIIGEYSFCSNGYKKVYIPASLKEIGHKAFSYSKVSEYIVLEGNENFSSVEGFLFSKDRKTLIEAISENGNSCIVPEGAETIGGSVFKETEINCVILPESVKTIESWAFAGFTGDVFVNSQLEYIEKEGFRAWSSGDNMSIYFTAGKPLSFDKRASFYMGDGTISLYYLEGTEDLWSFDENGLWNGYEVKPFSFNVCGDVDGNGKVNVLDANLIRRASAKLIELDYMQSLAADTDGNGKVNVLDANLIRRYAAKLIDKFPVEG